PLGDVEDAAQVDVDHLVPGAAVHLAKQAVARDAGVVDQDVDGVELAVHPRAHRLHRAAGGDVARVGLRTASHLADFLAHPFGRLDAAGAGADGHVGGSGGPA